MSALAKLWRWLQDRRRPAAAGTEAETVAAAAQLQQSDDDREGCGERDLRAARKELLQQENWRSRAGPWQQK